MRVYLLKFPARGAERRGGRGTKVRPMDDGMFGARGARKYAAGSVDSVPANGAAGGVIATDTE